MHLLHMSLWDFRRKTAAVVRNPTRWGRLRRQFFRNQVRLFPAVAGDGMKTITEKQKKNGYA